MRKPPPRPTKKHEIVPIPAQFAETLEQLRRATVEATAFAVPWAIFLDGLAMAPEFTLAGVPDDHETLRRVIETAVVRVAGACQCGALMLLHLGDFWHGVLETSFGPVVLYYFESDNSGFLRLIESGHSQLVRFSILELHTPLFLGVQTPGQA